MTCAKCTQLEDDLEFARTLIVDLQHMLRELQHELDNFKSPLAAERK